MYIICTEQMEMPISGKDSGGMGGDFMSDPVRCNKDEFISYLGTCMSFYKMHLTQDQQDASVREIAEVLRDHMDSRQCMHLMRALQRYSESSLVETFIYTDTGSLREEVIRSGNDAI